MKPSSPHFSFEELRCPDCKQNFCGQQTYDMLEEFRAQVGKPVIITSGYRCADHNKAVGGAQRSQHQFGTAADIRVAGMTATQLEDAAHKCLLIVGIGRNDRDEFLHIDCRSGSRVRWCYGADGKQCAYYPPTKSVEEVS